jgi:transcriptional regulator MraZ
VQGADPGVADIFRGKALNAVDAKGRLSVPAFVRAVIERRSDERVVVIGTHEALPCLTAYSPAFGEALVGEMERLKLADETRGGDRASHFARAHRLFTMADDVPYDPSGRIILPSFTRDKARIKDLALFAGVGPNVEIWNPHVALEEGDEDIKEVAAYLLNEKGLKP